MNIKPQNLNTKEENTWCPGCPNFAILEAAKKALAELANEKKIKIKDTAIVTGIGCHAKTFDYLNLNAFYGLHGRVLPICLGLKAGNPNLTVVGFGGDGDTFAEGLGHFVHNCRYNSDFTMLVHDNQIFALTVGQATPTTETGFIDGSTPFGVKEKPINPIVLALTSGASFVARGYAFEVDHLKNLLKEAITHKGFSFVDILEPCLAFHQNTPYLQKNIYKLDENHPVADFESALKKAQEWDYCFDRDQKIGLGVFYKKTRPVFEEVQPQKNIWHTFKRKTDWQKITKDFR